MNNKKQYGGKELDDSFAPIIIYSIFSQEAFVLGCWSTDKQKAPQRATDTAPITTKEIRLLGSIG